MNKKFLILVAVVGVVALGLMYRAAQSGTALVYLPSDLAAKGEGALLTRIRVAGRVAADAEIQYQTEPRAELRFSIVDPPPKETAAKMGQLQPPQGYDSSPMRPVIEGVRTDALASAGKPVPVLYRGLRPDMFTVGRDVIIDGEFRGGVLVASSLLTQCPSKYEAPSPEQKFKVETDSPQGNAS